MKTKNQRYRRAMTVQQRIAREMAAEKVGRNCVCWSINRWSRGPKRMRRRSIRGLFFPKPATVGEFIVRRIAGSRGYDLLA